MQLEQAIRSRKSVRKFSSKKPDWRDIIEAIDSARYAPMAGNIFSLRFIIIDDKEKIQKLSECCQQNFVSQAHYVVVVCTDKEKTKNSFGERAEKYLRQQAGASIQNFLLKIHESGLSTCWTGHMCENIIKKTLNIPDNIDVEAIFPIGYESKMLGSQTKQKNKIDLNRILYFNKWKNKRMEKPSVVKGNA